MLPMTKEDCDFEVQAALAWHDDDVLATVATLLGDIRHLREQLALTEGTMSRGITRGWKPSYERNQPGN